MPIKVPNFDHSGLTLRTRQQVLADRRVAASRFVIGEFVVGAAGSERAAAAAPPRACRTASRYALPLMRGTLTKPASQPISAPPGKVSFGTDW